MKNAFFMLGCFLITSIAIAQQFEASLQLRPRYEYRNGYKTLLEKDQDAASFVSQRSRLNLSFENENLEMKFSLQNIRVWGDVPLLTNKDNNGIAVFEAWGQYALNSNIAFKLGRQVLSYDNQRIFGEVDWAQQAQSHDAALLKLIPTKNHALDLGVAINAEKEELSRKPYEVNTYKNMQFGWYHITDRSNKISFLLLNAGYETIKANSKTEIQYVQTWGAYFEINKNKWNWNFAAYGQSGEKNGNSVQAWYGRANLNYKLSTILHLGLGTEYLSGTAMDNTSSESNSFTPLFGTNHGFNGFMDYFYVGNHQNSVGLIDVYTKFSYSKNNFGITLMPHFFASEATILDSQFNKMDKYLGTEIDLVGKYTFSKNVSFSMGYSQMFGTKSLQALKGGDFKIAQNWAWLSVNFTPKLFSLAIKEQ